MPVKKQRNGYILTIRHVHPLPKLPMNQVPPLRLTPDRATLFANRELLRLSKELSEIYASKDKLVTDEALRRISTELVGERWRSQTRTGVAASGRTLLPLAA